MNGSAASDAGLALAEELELESVVAARAGSVLFKGTILKSDHFPGKKLCNWGAMCFRDRSINLPC